MWNFIPNEERLHLWKSLREGIKNVPLEEKMDKVSKFFANAPYGARSIDYYSPDTWPTPWDILFHGKLCKSSISVLIYHTFVLLDENIDIDLYIINDNTDEYLVPVINAQFVLNYQLGTVNNYSDISDEVTIKRQFSGKELKQIS